jgi:pectate lyase
VIAVTHLNDSGPGSLRAAVEAAGPRLVVFRVAGHIELARSLEIKEPFLTIAGQTAPGGGICLKNFDCVISAPQVVIRYLRVRPGDVAGKPVDGFSIGGAARQVILDHCSASWSVDETLSVSGGDIGDITVQWCLIAESLSRSVHHKGPHGYGSLIRADGDVSYHHNLYAHHTSRNPRPGTYEDAGKRGLILDFRNNVIYGWSSRAGYSSGDKANVNYVGNFLKPNASSKTPEHAFNVGGQGTTRLHVAGNHLVGATAANRDNWLMIAKSEAAVRMAEPFPIAPCTTDPAAIAYEKVLAGAGAILPSRDAVDARIVQQVRAGTGRIIDSQRDVGGWPILAPGPAPADTDGDGMPDEWERRFGFNPTDPADGPADANGNGYTNVEEFLNGTHPR